MQQTIEVDQAVKVCFIAEVETIPQEEGGGFSACVPKWGRYSAVGDGDTVEEALSDLSGQVSERINDYMQHGTSAMTGVMAEALLRMESGRDKYGEFDPDTDDRDLLEEACEELLDAVNYCAMGVLQIRSIRTTLLDGLARAEREAQK